MRLSIISLFFMEIAIQPEMHIRQKKEAKEAILHLTCAKIQSMADQECFHYECFYDELPLEDRQQEEVKLRARLVAQRRQLLLIKSQAGLLQIVKIWYIEHGSKWSKACLSHQTLLAFLVLALQLSTSLSLLWALGTTGKENAEIAHSAFIYIFALTITNCIIFISIIITQLYYCNHEHQCFSPEFKITLGINTAQLCATLSIAWNFNADTPEKKQAISSNAWYFVLVLTIISSIIFFGQLGIVLYKKFCK